MTNQHPITPPPELLDQWAAEYWGDSNDGIANGEKHIATQAARWGADQELDACVSYVDTHVSGNRARALREARRPKPPSLKEKGLNALAKLKAQGLCSELADEIRRALEALPE
jgi:hypothetical protein